MAARAHGTALVFASAAFLTAAQVLMKAGLSAHGEMPLLDAGMAAYFWALLQNWRIWAGGLCLVGAAAFWYAGVSHIALSRAYALAAIAYPLIFLAAILILGEPFSWWGLAGNLLVVAGVVLAASARDDA